MNIWKRSLLLGLLLVVGLYGTAGAAKVSAPEPGGYIAPLSAKVTREKVSFPNRYGMKLAGDLYLAKNAAKDKKYPALVIGAPYGGVKEQGPCVYANELAQRGYAVLTFDQAFIGDSEGKPRNVSSPDIFTESFSAAVDYLGIQKFVDRSKIGVLGICGSGGFALSAAQCDTRIKAVATASMYDMTTAVRLGMDKKALTAAKDKLSAQRWVDAEKGYPEYIPMFPDKPLDAVPASLKEPDAEWFRFYALKRGFHPQARGGATTTSNLFLMNFSLLDHVDEISPRPILLIVGDRAHSRFFSEDVYKRAQEPKELYVVKDAEHIDLYDRTDRIPFGKIDSFFKENLNK